MRCAWHGPGGDEHVDDLPCLVDRAVHVAPLSADPDGGLIDLPAVADGVPHGRAALANSGVKRTTHR
jgi:hypothetical protein